MTGDRVESSECDLRLQKLCVATERQTVDPIHMGKTENRDRFIMHTIYIKTAFPGLKLYRRMHKSMLYTSAKELRNLVSWL